MFVCSVLLISVLDSQSKFQTLILFSGRHVGVPQTHTNMAAPYQALGQRTYLKLLELSSLSIVYNIAIS